MIFCKSGWSFATLDLFKINFRLPFDKILRKEHYVVMSFIEPLDKTDFMELARSTKTFVFLDFFATWCGPCVAMLPIIEELAQDPDFAGKVLFYKCNVDQVSSWAKEFKVGGIPAFFLVETNMSEEYQIIKEWLGFIPPDVLKADILLSINTKDDNTKDDSQNQDKDLEEFSNHEAENLC